MSSNENEVGVKAVFDIDEFSKNFTKYLADLNKANASTEAFYKKQEEATQKSATASKSSADKQTVNLRKVERAYQQAVTSMVVLFGGLVAAYKYLELESERLGDKETIAGFTALEQSVIDLSDSFAAMILQGAPVGDALKFITGGITALSQVVTITGASLKWFFTLLGGIPGAIDLTLKGKGSAIGAYLEDLNARANAAANEVIVAAVKAPANVASTKAADEAEKKRLADAKSAEEKRLQLMADYAQKHKDMVIKSGEDILSAEADLQSKSASAWADYMSKSADVIAEGVKKRTELLSTYTDAIASAETEFQRGSEDASYQHGRKLQDIERNYQSTIRQIQHDFGTESLDAARNLDAIGFRRAQEKRDAALVDAGRNRDESSSEESENYSRQLYELQRSLDDKKREAEQAYQRGLEEQRRAEAEAQAEAKSAYNAQLTDAQNAFNAKLAAIRASYTNEDAAAAAHYLNQEAAYRAHLAQMQAILASYGLLDLSTSPNSPNPRRERASGGLDLVSSPTQFLAGEAGPEMVFTMPLNRNVPAPVTQTVNHTGDFSHQIDSTIRSSVAGIDGRVTAAVARALREMLG